MYPKSLPLISLILLFVLGVYASYQDQLVSLWIVLISFLICLGYFSILPPLYWRNLGWGSLFLFLGLLVGKNDQRLAENHYLLIASSTQKNSFQITITKALRSTQKNYRYYGNIYKVNEKKAKGAILIHLPKKHSTPLSVGDNIAINDKIEELYTPLNPSAFNYKNYLKQLKIYHLVTLTSSPTPLKKSSNKLIRLKQLLIEQLQKTSLNKNSQQLLKTLLLGEKNSLNPATIEQYAQAGVVHLFAISGLHIGILMFLFQWVLSPLKLIPKGQYLHLICTFLFLWGYAFMVGASASVIRSVTLFSAVNIGVLSQRKLPIYYYVILSLGILLFIQPRFILQLGFQMSYLAVFGILYIYPLIQINFNNRFLRYFWTLTVITLSAQIAVAPLSIYHFNQFPGLFLISNWVILPFISVFLYVGLGYLTLCLFAPPAHLFSAFLNQLIGLLNRFVFWVGNQKAFLFDHLYISQYTMLMSYIAIIAMIIGGHQKRIIWFYLASLSFINGAILYQHELSTQELWIAHNYGKTILVEKNNGNLVFHSKDTLSLNAYIVKNYREKIAHKKIHFRSLKNAYNINGTTLVIVDGDWILGIEYPEKSQLLLKNNAKINLERLLKKHQPLRVIIDGSNSPYVIERWKRTLKEYAIPFHITSEQGALLLTPKSGSKVF